MAALNLPNKLWRPLAEVKNFVEKMSDGVRLPQMSQKVKSFASLSRKDKDILIRYLNERDCINVIQARPLSGGNLTTFFFHQKFGLPSSIPGFDWDGRPPKITMPVEEIPKHLLSPEPVLSEPVSDPDEEDAEQVDMSANPADKKLSDPVEIKPEVESPPDDETEVNGNQVDDLRKRALKMLMEADRADQSRLPQVLTTEIKPKIDEFINRLNQANDAVQTTLDTLYDQMGEVDKVAIEFKKFCESL